MDNLLSHDTSADRNRRDLTIMPTDAFGISKFHKILDIIDTFKNSKEHEKHSDKHEKAQKQYVQYSPAEKIAAGFPAAGRTRVPRQPGIAAGIYIVSEL